MGDDCCIVIVIVNRCSLVAVPPLAIMIPGGEHDAACQEADGGAQLGASQHCWGAGRLRAEDSWLFGVPMDTPVVKNKAEEDREDDIRDGSADGNDELSLSFLMTKRTATKRKMAAQRTRPLTVLEMNQYMHRSRNTRHPVRP